MSILSKKFALLTPMVAKARAQLDENSSVAQCDAALQAAHLSDFVTSQVKELTGMPEAVLRINRTNQPKAYTNIAYYKDPKSSEAVRAAGMKILAEYGKSTSGMKTPVVRDLFRVAGNPSALVVQKIPDPKAFKLVICLSRGLLLSKTDGVFAFTDREIAGIICHEIGHCVYAVNASMNIMAQDLAFSSAANTIRAMPPVSEVISILKIIKKDVPLQPPLQKVIDALLSAPVSDHDASYQQYVDMAVWAIMAVSANVKKDSLETWYPKLTDRERGVDTPSAVERYCDAFSATCGYGADMAAAVAKLSDGIYSPQKLALFTNRPVSSAFFIAVLNPFEEITASGYEPIYDRMKNAITATKETLADEELPKDIKEDILKSIAEGEKKYEEYCSQPYVQIRHNVSVILNAFESIRTFSIKSALFDLTKTYEDFERAIGVYRAGDLAYMASQLETYKA